MFFPSAFVPTHAPMFRFLLPILFVACSAQAAGVALSIDGAADYALKHNPTLAAARWRIDEARGRWQQSGRLQNPELEFEYARMTRGQEDNFGASFMQRFPLTSRLRH